jgi:hypothetical protein
MAPNGSGRRGAETLQTISSQLFRSDAAPSTIHTVIVTDDAGKRYRFTIDKSFFSQENPAFILKSITPESNADLLSELRHSKFWVYGGVLTEGGTMLLRQTAETQRFLTQRIPVASITVSHTAPAST